MLIEVLLVILPDCVDTSDTLLRDDDQNILRQTVRGGCIQGQPRANTNSNNDAIA